MQQNIEGGRRYLKLLRTFLARPLLQKAEAERLGVTRRHARQGRPHALPKGPQLFHPDHLGLRGGHIIGNLKEIGEIFQ